jgi:thiamine biosynthesis protein ThiS
MQITINGEAQEMATGSTLAGLIRQFRLDTKKLAVELNQAIVPRSLYEKTVLQAADAIEIVHFIGGG